MLQVIITTAVKSLFISRVSLSFLGCLSLWIAAASAEHTLISKDEFATQARNGIQGSKMPLDPQFFNYHSRPLAPNIFSTRPVDIEFPPGEKDRLFVVEHVGRIQVITDLNGDPEASTFLDITDRTYHEREAGLNGMAFHPNYDENGYFFVFYNYRDSSTGLKFAGILRLDVDEKPENLKPNPHTSVHGHYRVPKDNPFIGLTDYNDRFLNPEKIRTEIYAIGLRIPMRMESILFYLPTPIRHV